MAPEEELRLLQCHWQKPSRTDRASCNHRPPTTAALRAHLEPQHRHHGEQALLLLHSHVRLQARSVAGGVRPRLIWAANPPRSQAPPCFLYGCTCRQPGASWRHSAAGAARSRPRKPGSRCSTQTGSGCPSRQSASKKQRAHKASRGGARAFTAGPRPLAPRPAPKLVPPAQPRSWCSPRATVAPSGPPDA